MRKTCLRLLVVATMLLTGCATTQFHNIVSSLTPGVHYLKIIVHSDLADPATRKIVEDAVVQQLQSVGVNAVPSYSIFAPGTSTSWPVKQQVIQADGFDAGLLVKVVSSYSKITPEMFVNHNLVNIYTAHFKMQTTLMDMSHFTVVWQARSSSREEMADNGDVSVEGMMDSYASALVTELEREGVVVPTRN